MISGLWRKLAFKSLERYHRAAGGDALAIEKQPGQKIDLVPVKYISAEENDEGERAGWHVKGRDKTYDAGPEGNSLNFIGRTPTIPLHADAAVETGWLAPRIGTAIELDNYWPLFVGAEIKPVFDVQGPPGVDANGQAVADGGLNITRDDFSQFELSNPGMYAGDSVVDLSSQEGSDGMRISLRKSKEWQAETTTSEKMQMQEDRGYLMGLVDGNHTDAKRIFLYAVLLVLGVLAIVLLGPQLISGESVTSMNPLIASLGLGV